MSDAFALFGPEHQLEPSPIAVFTISGGRQQPVEASYPFLVIQEFTGPNPSVRVSYGEREYRLGVEGHHSLGSWLERFGNPSMHPPRRPQRRSKTNGHRRGTLA